jgi:ribosomal protein S18 acetylase RimI-like enzyme
VSIIDMVPMTEDVYASWRVRSIAEYASENVAAGRWKADEAPAQAELAFNQILADGRSTPGNYFWAIRDGGGVDVGVLWVAVTADRPDHAFIYEIWISPERRGEGFGSAALSWLESWAPANDIRTIGLHVFGHNEGARRLYQRTGYVETSVQMEKQL